MMDYPKNIFLVGMMGAGKSTIGKQLARQLNKVFLDADQEIERKTGVTIPIIFEIEGELGFRQREAQVIAELVHEKNLVLATGGGAVLLPENRQILSEYGVVIYLRATPEELFVRTRHDRGRQRPLLQEENPLAKIEKLCKEREEFYLEVANIIIDTNKQKVPTIISTIIEQLHALSSNIEQNNDN